MLHQPPHPMPPPSPETAPGPDPEEFGRLADALLQRVQLIIEALVAKQLPLVGAHADPATLLALQLLAIALLRVHGVSVQTHVQQLDDLVGMMDLDRIRELLCVADAHKESA